jgi:hypothetical protein
MEKNNLKQYYGIKFGLSYVPMKRFRKPLVMILSVAQRLRKYARNGGK